MTDVGTGWRVPTWQTAVPVVLAACAVAAQIAYPLTEGAARDRVTVAVVLLLAAASLTHAAARRGLGWAAVLFVVSAGGGFASELIGTATGYPYGCYAYAIDRIGPAVADVPLVVPLAWTAGLYPVWCVATRITRTAPGRVAAVTVGMVGWDLYLDPQMVADGQWVWCNGGGLPGIAHIPLTNYAGWVVVAAAMATVLLVFDSRSRRLSPRHDTVPIALFLWTWLGSALAHSVFLQASELRFSAIYGLVVMGILGVPLLRSLMSTAPDDTDRRLAATTRMARRP
ncbi:carotenoid biosynthesis protein [Rhodococcus sp. NPDC058639]|uniref:carotenoid biosynthesis protein n=1 Tax=Rhodococcus sp. NPDC058639 TaxID=3346570 RepID=UPI0036632A43